MIKNKWVLPASIIVAAIIILIGLNFLLPQHTEQKKVIVQLPSYLQKSTSTQSEGLPSNASDSIISFAADNGTTLRLISVSGSVTKTASPELAFVSLSIETLAKTATKSQSDNAVIANKVVTALENLGIASDDIETVSYNLQEEFQWNETLRKSVSVGYKTINTLRVKVRDLSKVGETIDAAVQAGANRVSSVSFGLTKETEAELKALALKEAAANARKKAENIASGLNISIGKVYSASESSSYSLPYYRGTYEMAVQTAAKSTPTPITPGDIEFTTTVNVQFEIQ